MQKFQLIFKYNIYIAEFATEQTNRHHFSGEPFKSNNPTVDWQWQ